MHTAKKSVFRQLAMQLLTRQRLASQSSLIQLCKLCILGLNRPSTVRRVSRPRRSHSGIPRKICFPPIRDATLYATKLYITKRPHSFMQVMHLTHKGPAWLLVTDNCLLILPVLAHRRYCIDAQASQFISSTSRLFCQRRISPKRPPSFGHLLRDFCKQFGYDTLATNGFPLTRTQKWIASGTCV